MFQPDDWQRLISSLYEKTTLGKVVWTDERESLYGTRHGALSALMRASGAAELVASVGSTSFRLGSSDGDGREPFFIEVSRRQEGGESVVDSIRTDTARFDPKMIEVALAVAMLYSVASEQVHAQRNVVNDIIAELDQL